MAGLLEKDIRLLWGTKQTLVILFAIAVAVAFSGNGNKHIIGCIIRLFKIDKLLSGKLFHIALAARYYKAQRVVLPHTLL